MYHGVILILNDIDNIYNILNQVYNNPGKALIENGESYTILIENDYIRLRNSIKLDSVTLSELYFLTRKGIDYLKHYKAH